MSERKKYITHAITFDMEGRTDGDFDDFERALHKLEVDFPGAMVLGTDWTESWPSYRVHESRPSLRAPEADVRHD
jgi:hypothetical protein